MPALPGNHQHTERVYDLGGTFLDALLQGNFYAWFIILTIVMPFGIMYLRTRYPNWRLWAKFGLDVYPDNRHLEEKQIGNMYSIVDNFEEHVYCEDKTKNRLLREMLKNLGASAVKTIDDEIKSARQTKKWCQFKSYKYQVELTRKVRDNWLEYISQELKKNNWTDDLIYSFTEQCRIGVDLPIRKLRIGLGDAEMVQRDTVLVISITWKSFIEHVNSRIKAGSFNFNGEFVGMSWRDSKIQLEH